MYLQILHRNQLETVKIDQAKVVCAPCIEVIKKIKICTCPQKKDSMAKDQPNMASGSEYIEIPVSTFNFLGLQ